MAAAERARGRPGRELILHNCAVDLDLMTPDGGIDINRLKLAGRKMIEAWRADAASPPIDPGGGDGRTQT